MQRSSVVVLAIASVFVAGQIKLHVDEGAARERRLARADSIRQRRRADSLFWVQRYRGYGTQEREQFLYAAPERPTTSWALEDPARGFVWGPATPADTPPTPTPKVGIVVHSDDEPEFPDEP